jgi:transcriptional regulator with XRE-family HTH domain
MALAHQMGLSLATIWRWENAERPASVDGLHLLAWALDVPPALLLGDDWSPLPDLDAWEQREVARRRRSQA